MSFSNEEKEIASTVTYNLNIDTVSGSQIQQGVTDSIQQLEAGTIDFKKVTQLAESITDSINDLGVEPADRKVLLADLATIQSQASSPKPKTAIIRESLKSVRTILEGASASALASGLLHQIGLLLG